ncbi:CDP-diacylglycerol--inositol 3-phosphatidyltransferase [Acaryochloris thomasi RCC1774]|uniref:CDP-diacylglycerol--inositol 3-phosphatidyltransferase n=1 Tax=Acaryochloris thomasi RCC1774 TaxID=1764569 RepID=A0A2W1K405_9CYAN|nr:CDP-alcohol phosphatidyltransferase family protein [Acaryochloris thomasi]PZD74781.1 CDP-diacylglycerol--inositol 3-phosphatidyltransferase [Acaryochloris thomasi RCC1774]
MPTAPTSWLDQTVQILTIRLARLLAGWAWITPNRITWFSAAVGGVLAGGLILQGQLRWAALAVIISGLLDGLDGDLARERGTTSTEGAILDSVLDRYVDFLILAALIWISPRAHLAAGLLALLGTAMVPYIRARSEAAGKSSVASIGSRAVRMVLVILGLLTGQILPLLILVGAIANIAALHRLTVAITPQSLDDDPESEAAS